MKTFQLSDCFVTKIPNDWKTESDGHIIALYDQDNGVGILQFSFYKRPDSNPVNLSGELETYLEDAYGHIKVELLNEYAYFSIIDEDNIYWGYWLFNKSDDIMFVSYNCEGADRNKEEDIINEIIKSIL